VSSGRRAFPTVDLGVDLGGPPSSKPRRAAPPSEDTILAALGGAAAVPRMVLSTADLKALPLGSDAAFVLSQIDGMSSVDDIIDISGFPRADTLRILHDLVQAGVIKTGR